MRENVKSLSWTLWIVIIAFIIYYIPNIVGGSRDYVAQVGGEKITMLEYQKTFKSRMDNMRQMYQNNFSADLVRQMNLGGTVLSEMINTKILLAESTEQGIFATDEEVSEYIRDMKPFQDQAGRFIGGDRYRMLLSMYDTTPEEFEQSIRETIIYEKFRNLVTAGIIIPEDALEKEYRRQNEMIQSDYLTVDPAKFKPDVEISDEDLDEFFSQNREIYRTEERRNFDYVFIKTADLQKEIDISNEEAENEYEKKRDSVYKQEAQRQARHILLRVQPDASPEEVEEIRKKAADIRNKYHTGEDFADLAKKYSDDPSKDQGGDLGLFPRGRMVPEFDEKVFSMAVGEVSEPVKTTYGWHIIKLEKIEPEGYIPFGEVKEGIRRSLAWPLAREQAGRIAAEIAEKVKMEQSLEKAAAESGYPLEETGFFEAGKPVKGVGTSKDFSDVAFSMAPGDISDAIEMSLGNIVIQLKEIKEPYLPELEEVQSYVQRDLEIEKSEELARAKAENLKARLQQGEDLESVAKKNDLTVENGTMMNRMNALPNLGPLEDYFDTLFALEPDEISEVIEIRDKFALFKLVDKQAFDAEKYREEKESVREQMLARERNTFFGSAMNSLRKKWYTPSENELLKQQQIVEQITSQFIR